MNLYVFFFFFLIGLCYKLLVDDMLLIKQVKNQGNDNLEVSGKMDSYGVRVWQIEYCCVFYKCHLK